MITHRFKHNAIVEYLLDNGGIDLNHIARMGSYFSEDDKTQFAQLIGYSVCGASDLSYFSNDALAVADAASDCLRDGAKPLTKSQQNKVLIKQLKDRIKQLEKKLEKISDIVVEF